MVGYDRHSETAEVLVNNDGLAIPSLLKVQSFLFGNIEGCSIFSLIKNSHIKIKNYQTIYAAKSLMAMR
jgi:hypothetical protein